MIKKRINISKKQHKLLIFHSNKHIYAQIIRLIDARIIITSSTLNLAYKKSSVINAYIVGEALAKKAIELNVTDVFFDKKNYSYKGQVKALIEGVRATGLII